MRLLVVLALFGLASLVHSCADRLAFPNYFFLKGEYVVCSSFTQTECEMSGPHAVCHNIQFENGDRLSYEFTKLNELCAAALPVIGLKSNGTFFTTTQVGTGLKVYTGNEFISCNGTYITRLNCGIDTSTANVWEPRLYVN